jgi:hypothetical protein
LLPLGSSHRQLIEDFLSTLLGEDRPVMNGGEWGLMLSHGGWDFPVFFFLIIFMI